MTGPAPPVHPDAGGVQRPPGPAAFDAVRRLVAEVGVEGLGVDDLREGDLVAMEWSGGPLHVVSMVEALRRVGLGEVEYLVVRAPSGEVVAKAGIDYVPHPGAGSLWALATHEELRGLGLATYLIAAAEERIARRSLTWATVGVEDDNPRARSLYERLGYQPWRRESASWDSLDGDGRVVLYHTTLTVLRKTVGPTL